MSMLEELYQNRDAWKESFHEMSSDYSKISQTLGRTDRKLEDTKRQLKASLIANVILFVGFIVSLTWLAYS